MSIIDTNSSLLSLLQWCDSSLPTGAFSHSFGLETYVQDEKVLNKQTFLEWLQIYVREQLVYTDGLASRLTYEALEKDDMELIWSLDAKISVQNLARETRDGNKRIADRMLHLAMELYASPILQQYQQRIKDKQCWGHSSIVFAMIAHHLHIPQSTAVVSYLYASTVSLVQNGVRAIPLGQTDGQRLIQELQSTLNHAVEQIQQLDQNDFGITSPGLELSQMRHERLNIRLFMS
ncbi:urease accessory protein UreF [Paenibacillus endoradicis]|uniref:urease accessory protein UreF n=1 Tax=Paenibacillus endoradicis TaxID=2972487 RepID=UPI002158C412|nr:urease accessory protein UreF [Paenibacillus endoradicis]MCR8659798.1 urease accessory protein UreF [Paenibacillus endoradicis]